MFEKCCDRCGEKFKRKQFYKDGVKCEEQLLKDLKESSYLFDCFDFEKTFEFDWLCEPCYNELHEEMFEKAKEVQVSYHNVKVFENTFKGEYVLEAGKSPYGFELMTNSDERALKLSHLKFYAYWNGYNAVINLVEIPVEDGIKLSGSLVHLVKEKKSGHDLDKWLQQLEGLEKLGGLFRKGVLTEEEFLIQKKKVIK